MINVCAIVGRVGHTPEIRVTQSGKKVCRLSIATSSFYNSKMNTDWHTVVCFDKSAEIVEKYVKKGAIIGIVGRIQYDKYKGKDGTEKTATSIIASQVQFINLNNGEQQPQQTINSDGTPAFGAEVNPNEPDEIPF